MNLIEVSGVVAEALKADERITAIVGDRIFPVVALHGVNGYPFVTYRNLGKTDNDSKDQYGELSGRVELEVAAQTYESAVTTSEEIRRVLEANHSGIDFEMSNYEEEFDADLMVYISVIQFDYDED